MGTPAWNALTAAPVEPTPKSSFPRARLRTPSPPRSEGPMSFSRSSSPGRAKSSGRAIPTRKGKDGAPAGNAEIARLNGLDCAKVGDKLPDPIIDNKATATTAPFSNLRHSSPKLCPRQFFMAYSSLVYLNIRANKYLNLRSPAAIDFH